MTNFASSHSFRLLNFNLWSLRLKTENTAAPRSGQTHFSELVSFQKGEAAPRLHTQSWADTVMARLLLPLSCAFRGFCSQPGAGGRGKCCGGDEHLSGPTAPWTLKKGKWRPGHRLLPRMGWYFWGPYFTCWHRSPIQSHPPQQLCRWEMWQRQSQEHFSKCSGSWWREPMDRPVLGCISLERLNLRMSSWIEQGPTGSIYWVGSETVAQTHCLDQKPLPRDLLQ